MPAWLTNIQNKLPISLQWMVPLAVTTIVKLVFPKLEEAFPGEKILIQDIAEYLTGGRIPQALKEAHAAYFQAKESETNQALQANASSEKK